MSDLIPFVLKQEQVKIRKEIQGRHVESFVMELPALIGEALSIVVHFVSEDLRDQPMFDMPVTAS